MKKLVTYLLLLGFFLIVIDQLGVPGRAIASVSSEDQLEKDVSLHPSREGSTQDEEAERDLASDEVQQRREAAQRNFRKKHNRPFPVRTFRADSINVY
jgi:hypothetical protein